MECAASILRLVREFVFPARCLRCGELGGGDSTTGLCPGCDALIPRLPARLCPRCAGPLALATPGRRGAARCASCRSSPPPFRRTVAGSAYEGIVREMVMDLKFGRDRLLARVLGGLVVEALRAAPDRPDRRVDCVIPLPLSPARRRRRGFNQAELLAVTVSAAIAKPLRTSILSRVRDDPPQTLASSRRARRARLKGAFLARLRRRVDPPRILLVNDVMTTGGTAEEASR